MDPNERTAERTSRRGPTLADVLARQLARLGLIWATQAILGGLAIVVALGLLFGWGLLLVAIAWVGGLLGLTSGTSATPFLIGAIVVSGLILFRPTRWAARNLLRTQGALEATIDRLAVPTTLGPSTTVAPRPATTGAELRALDARLKAATGTPESVDPTPSAEPDRRQP